MLTAVLIIAGVIVAMFVGLILLANWFSKHWETG